MAIKQNLSTWKERNDIKWDKTSYLITGWWFIWNRHNII